MRPSAMCEMKGVGLEWAERVRRCEGRDQAWTGGVRYDGKMGARIPSSWKIGAVISLTPHETHCAYRDHEDPNDPVRKLICDPFPEFLLTNKPTQCPNSTFP